MDKGLLSKSLTVKSGKQPTPHPEDPRPENAGSERRQDATVTRQVDTMREAISERRLPDSFNFMYNAGLLDRDMDLLFGKGRETASMMPGGKDEILGSIMDNFFDLSNNTLMGLFSLGDEKDNEAAVQLLSQIVGSMCGVVTGAALFMLCPVIGLFVLMYASIPDKILDSIVNVVDTHTGGVFKRMLSLTGHLINDKGLQDAIDGKSHQKAMSDKILESAKNAFKRRGEMEKRCENGHAILQGAQQLFKLAEIVKEKGRKKVPDGSLEEKKNRLKALKEFKKFLEKNENKMESKEFCEALATIGLDLSANKDKALIAGAAGFFNLNKGYISNHLEFNMLAAVGDLIKRQEDEIEKENEKGKESEEKENEKFAPTPIPLPIPDASEGFAKELKKNKMIREEGKELELALRVLKEGNPDGAKEKVRKVAEDVGDRIKELKKQEEEIKEKMGKMEKNGAAIKKEEEEKLEKIKKELAEEEERRRRLRELEGMNFRNNKDACAEFFGKLISDLYNNTPNTPNRSTGRQ